ncbi:MAG: putative C-S lyase, partial [Tissierellia bacterium]|nr:putative C-S lyase [Tissierellia bacterium]
MTETKFHDFDEIINRINTDSYKWDYEGEKGKYIPLGVADSDFKSPIEIVNKLREKVDFGVYAYGYLPKERFSNAIINWYQKRFNIDLKPENIRHAQGLMTGALWMILNAFTRPGDKILIQPPIYSTFKVVVEGSGRFVENNNLILNDGQYEIDFDDLEIKTQDPKVRILLLCNPHNPIGRIWTKAELEKIYEICKRNNCMIISDEVHGDLIYKDNQHISFLEIAKYKEDEVIIMNSPSKTFNLASFYTAYILSKNDYLLEQYDIVYNNHHFDYNYFGIEALITAYNECDYYVDQKIIYLENNIRYFRDFLKTNMPKMKFSYPQGTYCIWLDCRDMNMSQTNLMEFFEKSGVKVNDGANYGLPGNGFVRVNIACPLSTLKQ